MKYDIVIIGAATAGSYFAHLMAKKGYSVKVIEKMSKDEVANRFDIFHILKEDFEKFNLPLPKEGDADYAFTYNGGKTISPYGNYPKATDECVVGMHLHQYTLRLNQRAKKAGAEIEYQAEFIDFIYSQNNKICGIKYKTNGKTKSVNCKLVVDCSGTSSAARKKLPNTYGVDNSPLTDKDFFFVILRYVNYNNPKDYVNNSKGWPYYKTWEAPQADPTGSIIGIGASKSFEFGEEVYKEFEKSIKLPDYTLDHIEKGITPYIQSLYSFVGDNFLVTGDAACLTKPNNGEGITSAMVHMDIAAKIADIALKEDDLSKEKLWQINVDYNRGQGADFAFMRPILIKAVASAKDEFEYYFKKDIIFSEKFLSGKPMKTWDFIQMGCRLIAGVINGKISKKTFRSLKEGIKLGSELSKLYRAFPQNIAEFETWKQKADALWQTIGKMSDNY